MATLVTGTPGSGKTTLVKYAKERGDDRFFDADEIAGLCEWREFATGRSMGLVSDVIETGEDEWYEQYGWYWVESFLKEFIADNPNAVICGSSENVVKNYYLFQNLLILKKQEEELISNLNSPERNNPFGKTTKQRSGFMDWQNYLIEGANSRSQPFYLIEGNKSSEAYGKIIDKNI